MLTDTALLVGSIAGALAATGYLWLWPRQSSPPAANPPQPSLTSGTHHKKEPTAAPTASPQAISETAQSSDDPFLRGAAKLDRLVVDAMDAMTAIEREVHG